MRRPGVIATHFKCIAALVVLLSLHGCGVKTKMSVGFAPGSNSSPVISASQPTNPKAGDTVTLTGKKFPTRTNNLIARVVLVDSGTKDSTLTVIDTNNAKFTVPTDAASDVKTILLMHEDKTLASFDIKDASLGTLDAVTFSPAAGTYYGPQSVTISSNQPGATIYYTTDGSTPTTNSAVYVAAIPVATSKTITAYAVKSGFKDSVTATSFYTVNGAVQTPVASVTTGAFSNNQSVTLSTVPMAASIYYTTDGTTPTTGSTPYTGTITVSGSTVLKAMATMTNYSNSAVMTETYTLTAATPMADIAEGSYGPPQTVTLSSATMGAIIHYTTDNSSPTCASATGLVSVTATMTVKAIACKTNYTVSTVASFAYTINGTVATPTTNLPVGTYHVPTHTATLSSATTGAVIHRTTDGSTPTCASATGAVSVTESMTVKAIACKTGYTSSTQDFTYTINTITPVAIEAFPDTTAYPSVTWTPNVKFSITSSDTIGLFSNTSGTAINPPTAASSGSNTFLANTVSTLAQTNTVYAKFATDTSYFNMGSYTTKLPANVSMSGANGDIRAIVKDDKSSGCTTAPNCLIVGGDFTVFGTKLVNRIARIKRDGSIEALGTGIDAGVYALAVDSSGNVYAGGAFSTAGGVTTNNIAKWDPTTSTWSALGSGMNSEVDALAVDSSGNLYAGGFFTSAGGVTANYIAKWNGTSWSALGSGLNGGVLSLALDGSGNLYVGGGNLTTMAGGAPANRIAKWNPTTSTWSALGNGMDSEVNVLAVDGSGNLYAGGCFGMPAGNIAKWDGTSWSALGDGESSGGCVGALAFDGSGNLYAGGGFSYLGGGVTTNNIAKWDGTSWSALGDSVDPYVVALAFDGSGNLYAGGNFGNAGGVPTSNIAKWDGASWSALGDGLDSSVSALAFDNSGNLYAGGSFITTGGVAANRIAKWNSTTSTWSALGSGLDGPARALAFDTSDNLYVLGNFTTAGGVPANAVAKWDGTNWSALGSGLTGNIVAGGERFSALAVDGSGNLYAAGAFSTAGGVSANGVAQWNGTSWSALGSGMDDRVFALAFDGSGNLYAGGSFTTAGGAPANRVAKWNGASWSSLGTGLNNNANSLAVDGSGNLYAGGSFTTVGGVAANGVAKWNGTSWSALGDGIVGDVISLAVDGSGNLYAGGSFYMTVGGVAVNGVAKWDGTSWGTLGSGMNGDVGVVALDGSGNLYVGGNFSRAGDLVRPYIAKWMAAFSSWF